LTARWRQPYADNVYRVQGILEMPTPRATNALNDFTGLLEHDISYPGWHNETAKNIAFYIRGYTWFKENVLDRIPMNITGCKEVLPRQKEIILGRTSWKTPHFDWNEKLAPDQIHKAVSFTKRKPIQFSKAVEATVVFEAIAELLAAKVPEFDPLDVYDRIRIEAAVSYINDFDLVKLEALKKEDPSFFPKLRAHTGQSNNAVFFDMANGNTVTQKLAESVAAFVRPHIDIGDVGFRLNRGRRAKPSARLYGKMRLIPLRRGG
jgi:hypothetical protein